MTEGAAEIASIAAHRENIGARVKARQRLLFYRVESERSYPAVIGSLDFSVLAGPGSAKAEPALGYIAVSEANLTNCHSSYSVMANHFESLERILFELVYAGFLLGYLYLLSRRVYSFQIGKQQAALSA